MLQTQSFTGRRSVLQLSAKHNVYRKIFRDEDLNPACSLQKVSIHVLKYLSNGTYQDYQVYKY